MKLEEIKVLQFMICLFIYLFFKKNLDVIIDVKYPTYKNLKYGTTFWKFLVNLRRILTIVLFLVIVSFLYFNKVNSYIFNFCLLMIISFIIYFAIDERLIYLLIPKNKKNEEIVNFMDIYTSTTIDIILLFYSIYIIFNIFNPFIIFQ
jgi:hypothetical protein